MNKSMYSLMLMDEVVKEVDRYAYLHNTNRSNLINQILAEYLHVKTPEMISREVFQLIAQLIENEPFKVVLPLSGNSLSIRSSLQYKYRPTIRYSIELYRSFTDGVGELTVTFRTQSIQLLSELAGFFNNWMAAEENYSDCRLQYFPESGKFVRQLKLRGGIDYQDIGTALANYILMFDEILKTHLDKGYAGYDELVEDYLRLVDYYKLEI